MKLVVLGASGGCGRKIVETALARGHDVTGVGRESSNMGDGLGARVLRGDLTSEAFLREAFCGADAVLSALGLRLGGLGPWNRPEDPTFLDRSTPAMIEAMRHENVRRAVVISAAGVADSRERVPAMFRLFVKTTALRHAYVALERMERLFLDSGLDVTVARPTGLSDGPATGSVVVAHSLAGRSMISRADVAAWMLDEVVHPGREPPTRMITVTGAA